MKILVIIVFLIVSFNSWLLVLSEQVKLRYLFATLSNLLHGKGIETTFENNLFLIENINNYSA